MKIYRMALTVGLAATLLAGCASTQPQSTYAGTPGVIISANPITLKGSGGIGTFAGLVAGAYGGSRLTENKKAQMADAAGGAVVGAALGNVLEHAFTSKQGTEYIVKTVNGTVVTVDQPTDPNLQINQRVIVIYQKNNQPKLIPDYSMPDNRVEVHHYHHYPRDQYQDDDSQG